MSARSKWSLLPFLLFLVLRSFLAALERPGWALFIGLLASRSISRRPVP